MSGERVFISYRRSDSAPFVGRLADSLRADFGREAVFQDYSSIAPGADFAAAIQREIDRADVVLVVIGRDWLVEDPESGAPRLFAQEDFVRREILAALASAPRVIPIRADGAALPARHELPEDLGGLMGRNALSVQTESWEVDLHLLSAEIEEEGGAARAAAELRDRGRFDVIACVPTAAALGAAAAFQASPRLSLGIAVLGVVAGVVGWKRLEKSGRGGRWLVLGGMAVSGVLALVMVAWILAGGLQG